MVFTDPPYNVKISGIGSGTTFDKKLGKNVKSKTGVQFHGEFAMASGEMTEDEFIQFLKCAFDAYSRYSINGSIHYVCMDWRHMYEIIMAGRSSYTELKQLIVWNKDNGGMGTFYRSKHELIFIFKNGTEKHINNFKLGETGRCRTNVWDYPCVNSFATRQRSDDNTKSIGNQEITWHPTVKPVKMVADAILDCSNENGLIADFFLGSGTTMVAAHQTGRRCYGLEIAPGYCAVILERLSKLGLTPVKSD